MRIISRLDIKNNFVIKGINLEGLRKVGDPIELATKYYLNNIDEIIYVDAIASLYRKNTLSNLIFETSDPCSEGQLTSMFLAVTLADFSIIFLICLALRSGK